VSENKVDQSDLSFSKDAGEVWYALYTRVRRERIVEARLRTQGLTAFVPFTTEVHTWSDRHKTVEVPIFASYVFVRAAMNESNRRKMLTVDGVAGLVGNQGRGTPIPDSEIDAVHALVSSQICWTPYAFMKVGARVRIHGGALDGIEGTLLSDDGNNTLVVSVELLGRSLAVSVAGYQIEVLPPAKVSLN